MVSRKSYGRLGVAYHGGRDEEGKGRERRRRLGCSLVGDDVDEHAEWNINVKSEKNAERAEVEKMRRLRLSVPELRCGWNPDGRFGDDLVPDGTEGDESADDFPP